MGTRSSHSVLLFALALIFTAGLTFASIELPYVIDHALMETVRTPGFDSHADVPSQFMAELFISHYHLRIIGYACFALTLVLIAAGFFYKKSSLAAIGAIAFMLPVFAQFAGVMFFLAGLGLLNLLWLPVLDISFEIQRLGLIIRAPYDLVMWMFRQAGLSAYWPLVVGCIGGGLLIFFLGTFDWLRARSRDENVAHSWVYRFSRHPQYMGWILWTYGVFLLLLQARYPKRSWGIDASLSWLLATMVIIGVAMIEELTMRQRFGESYDAYRRMTPFLFPVPRFVSRLFSIPMRLIFRKEQPEKVHEVVAVLFLYTALLIGTSAFFYGPGLNSSLAIVTPAEYLRSNMEALALQIRETENARQRYFLATHLAAYGTPSLDFLLPMLKDDDPEIRIAAAHQMRNVPSSEAVPALIEALGDSLEDVRGSALLALALITAPESVEPMRRLLLDPIPWVQVRALQSLAAMGEDVSEFASVGLESPHLWYRIRCLNVLGMLRNEHTVAQVEHQLASENVHIRRAAVAALASIGSAESRQALERAQSDDDWEVRMYATEALEILNSKEK